MSFSSEVKNELSRLEVEGSCCINAELSALWRMGGSILVRRIGLGVDFSTENAALARRILQITRRNFDLPIEVSATRARRLKKNNRYLVRVAPGKKTKPFMDLLGILPSESGNKLTEQILKSACCQKAFLRGVFLAAGSISKPTSDYHLEIVSQSKELADFILAVMKRQGIHGKITDRKGDYIVYIKEGDAIIKLLSVMGAHGALLEFENVRVIKDMRNHVNRVVNCETANLGKVVKAALKQIECIKYIDDKVGLHKLSPTLHEAAQLRLDNPEAPLSELAQMSKNNVSKAGMNHRFRKLEDYAKSLGMEDETRIEK